MFFSPEEQKNMNAHILIFPLDYIPHYVGTPTQLYEEAELLKILQIAHFSLSNCLQQKKLLISYKRHTVYFK